MADLKISQLTGATTPLAGSEEVPIVQSGTTKKVTVANLTAGRAVTASTVGAGTTVPANYTLGTNGPLYFASASFPGVPSAGTASAYGSAANGMVFWGNGSTYDLVLGNKNADECMTVATNQRAVKFWDNVIIGTSGKGIDFSATAGTGTSELLTDYEEGTFTPVLDGETTSPTVGYSTQFGSYTKIGRVVNFYIRLTLSSLSGGSGNAIITGLPFTVGLSNSPFASAMEVSKITFGVGYTSLSYRPLSAQTFGRLNQFGTTLDSNATTISQVSSTADIIISGSYSV